MKKEQLTVDRLEEGTVILQDMQENIITVPLGRFDGCPPTEGTVFSVEIDENGTVRSVEPLPEDTQKKRASIRKKMQLLRMRAKNRK